MSADNQVEPVAAMAAAAASSGSAPGSGSEYLKRTCLICGCQTNQTINIYEPRSGPNIVQLIQAKFKFQPLNEDKFLCFSCNNWLINWHSLQAVNSNDANESQSQSRSQSPSHMGNNLVQQRQRQNGDPPMERARLRPVAQVRPQPQPQVPPQSQSAAQPQPFPALAQAPVISYNKRCFASGRSASSSQPARKMLRHCCVCGAAMVLRLLSTTPAQTLSKLARRSGQRSQCRKCREGEISKWRRLHKRSVAKVLQLQRELRQKKQQQKQKQQQINVKEQTLVMVTLPYQRFQAPRVDGKVVAMFRRLGTTLSAEQDQESSVAKPTERPLRIMSPVKQRPRWTRKLDDDEILLEFDSVISEVLPAAPQPTPLSTTARRRLCYQFTDEREAETETVMEVELAEKAETKDNRKSVHKLTHQTHENLAGLQLPQGLSITLI
ncbi:hypothetical protein ACLKA6_006275 [Drosophila palustris]